VAVLSILQSITVHWQLMHVQYCSNSEIWRKHAYYSASCHRHTKQYS